jgi:hypothetical protein
VSLRYDVDFNRRAREARERQRWGSFLRTLYTTAFLGGLVALSVLYALLVRDRHSEVAHLTRERHKQSEAPGARPALVAPALEVVMAAKASPEMWADRLARIAKLMPDDGELYEFEGGDANRDAKSPVRGGTMVLSGRFTVPPGSASMTGPLTRWMDALHADSAFQRGVGEIRLESSRVISVGAVRRVEFRIVAR